MTSIGSQPIQRWKLLLTLLALLGAAHGTEAQARRAAGAEDRIEIAQAPQQSFRLEADREFQRGNVNRAIQIWSQLILQGQDVEASLYNRIQAYLVIRQFPLALADLNSLERIQRPQINSNTYLLRGITLNELHDFPGALKNFNLALGQDRNPLVYANRAITYQNNGRLDLAEADLNQAVLSEASPASLYNLAAIQRQLGHYKQCLLNLNRAIGLNGGFPPAYSLRGICHYYLGAYNLAMGDLLRANALDPGQPESYHYLGLSLAALKRPNEANQFLLKAADLYLGQNDQIRYQQLMQLLTKSRG
jgi:tetratricopeptide (TPR) repeat protein